LNRLVQLQSLLISLSRTAGV